MNKSKCPCCDSTHTKKNGKRNGKQGIVRKKCGSLSDNTEFTNKDGSDNLNETIEANYKRVKQEMLIPVDSEVERIKNGPALKHLMRE